MKNNNLFVPKIKPDLAVLFVVFNRPDATSKVFEAIRKAKPQKLYVAADGARSDRLGELALCNAVRRIAVNVDWPCEIKTLFRNQNLGCGFAVKSAIDWFFEHEEEGVILEDDTVPTTVFFEFCTELLNKYRTDTRIAMIAGTNHIGYQPKFSSYIFSKNKACWGWATWRRAWLGMDFDMAWRMSAQAKSIAINMGQTNLHLAHWKSAISYIDRGLVSAWDWQWYFSVASQNQLTIFPSVNLVSNIGFGDDATHTKGKPNSSYILTGDLSFPIVHPKYVCPDFEFDEKFEKFKMRKSNSVRRFIPSWAKNLIRRIVNI